MTVKAKEILWHIALHKFKPEATPEQRAEIFAMIANLGEACGGEEAGIRYWLAGANLDTRKGFDIAEVAMFESWEAKERFRASEAHTKFVKKLSLAADWVVGNIEGPWPLAGLQSSDIGY